MLQLSGFGEIDPCAADPMDPVCREIHPGWAAYGMSNTPVNDDTSVRASACGYNTWWDGSRCQPFVDDGTKPTKPVLASMTSGGMPTKTIAIVAALGLAGWLLYKRRA